MSWSTHQRKGGYADYNCRYLPAVTCFDDDDRVGDSYYWQRTMKQLVKKWLPGKYTTIIHNLQYNSTKGRRKERSQSLPFEAAIIVWIEIVISSQSQRTIKEPRSDNPRSSYGGRQSTIARECKRVERLKKKNYGLSEREEVSWINVAVSF